MKPLRDPEKAELGHLVSACDLNMKTVLEIGCGDGTITRQYGRLPYRVVGIDPAGTEVQVAHKRGRHGSQFFLQGEGEKLPFPTHSFEMVIFAASL